MIKPPIYKLADVVKFRNTGNQKQIGSMVGKDVSLADAYHRYVPVLPPPRKKITVYSYEEIRDGVIPPAPSSNWVKYVVEEGRYFIVYAL